MLRSCWLALISTLPTSRTSATAVSCQALDLFFLSVILTALSNRQLSALWWLSGRSNGRLSELFCAVLYTTIVPCTLIWAVLICEPGPVCLGLVFCVLYFFNYDQFVCHWVSYGIFCLVYYLIVLWLSIDSSVVDQVFSSLCRCIEHSGATGYCAFWQNHTSQLSYFSVLNAHKMLTH